MTSGFTGVYLFFYSVHYFITKLQIVGHTSTFLYFGYTAIMVVLFSLLTGKCLLIGLLLRNIGFILLTDWLTITFFSIFLHWSKIMNLLWIKNSYFFSRNNWIFGLLLFHLQNLQCCQSGWNIYELVMNKNFLFFFQEQLDFWLAFISSTKSTVLSKWTKSPASECTSCCASNQISSNWWCDFYGMTVESVLNYLFI